MNRPLHHYQNASIQAKLFQCRKIQMQVTRDNHNRLKTEHKLNSAIVSNNLSKGKGLNPTCHAANSLQPITQKCQRKLEKQFILVMLLDTLCTEQSGDLNNSAEFRIPNCCINHFHQHCHHYHVCPQAQSMFMRSP